MNVSVSEVHYELSATVLEASEQLNHEQHDLCMQRINTLTEQRDKVERERDEAIALGTELESKCSCEELVCANRSMQGLTEQMASTHSHLVIYLQTKQATMVQHETHEQALTEIQQLMRCSSGSCVRSPSSPTSRAYIPCSRALTRFAASLSRPGLLLLKGGGFRKRQREQLMRREAECHAQRVALCMG